MINQTNNMLCPYCKSEDISLKKEIISNLNKKQYSLYACKGCLLEFFTPLEFEDVYETEKNESYKEFHVGRKFLPEWTKQIVSCLRKIKFNFSDGLKILEIGSGDGINFVALQKFFDVSADDYFAVELDSKSIEVCKKRGIKNVIQAYFDRDISKKLNHKFDLILVTEVLEHQIAPCAFLETAFELLNESGLLIITVPNRRRAFINYRSEDGDVPPHHFLRFDLNFFQKNFKDDIVFIKEYAFSNKTLFDSSVALSNYLFRSKHVYFLMLPIAVVLRLIDCWHGEGILVFIKKPRS